ncbi:MAG: hypothetical protein A3F94_00680 [Candidatus Spechtbacteria bacterium RIFCSPLOWO2_12_FULL_38_22]|uniref:Peptidase M50 domain-containing protein n=1 Tax=Candidatus Spechtbacteria bacterium RIFCSPLOWO2_12_FULL_38_22 TaxID=1802165 RepID=A0A1G2HHP3_9BACT|nr:MAG: hypothetical protein A2728_02885 [Candidatus Spechtbacteria bacterium RIFCSPHIGHO2_01_FULL_38_11]OGZ60015.1 MAG: hypothetical protein A3E58_01565 [Candidatus Spechtbacteria bacterium RIFCSPHIGHO2_12_FULL_38_30]OGZ60701.1 MAG: hypothetical protein A3A00_02100 [Candidatus Spechtbacteria bacterium RIFCSPLOWO2_01_FULL_38_20]OGZ61909.1 MAG: hypothetical protein A3F94_00680 [Candidatus Spechtbacteria bacterium RIFCSPLOWO2_12_FULL_38_22]
MLKSAKRKFWINIIVIAFFAVLLHEFAHLLAALSLGLDVNAYSIGFGPQMFSWQWGGIEWRIGPILLGGFVELTEMSNDLLATVRPWWHMFWFSSVGVALNGLIAFAALRIYKKYYPPKTDLTKPGRGEIFLMACIYVNGLLFIFNLLPFMFLDGWKVWGSLFLAVLPQLGSLWVFVGYFGFMFMRMPLYRKLENTFLGPVRNLRLLK